MIDKLRILYLLELSLLVVASIHGPEGYCLGHCTSCDPYSLARCQGKQPCEWGFHDPDANGNCQTVPSLQLDSQELGQRLNKAVAPQESGWGSQLTKCQYQSLGSKQVIDVVGLFNSYSSIENTYPIPIGTELFELSFTLVRTEWTPVSDFILVEISLDGQQFLIEQIFQPLLPKMDSPRQIVQVSCGGQNVILEKYRITIAEKIKGQVLSVLFSSFLDQGWWGITNIKTITGCLGFSRLSNGTCSQCSEGSYFVQVSGSLGVCKSCPSLCKTCTNAQNCTVCQWGSLLKGQCVSANYKPQSVDLGSSISTCSGILMTLSDQTNKVILPKLINLDNHLYDQIVISVTVYYDLALLEQPSHQLSLMVNSASVFVLDVNNSDVASERCDLFGSGRMARLRVVSGQVHVADNALVVGVGFEGVKTFGVADINVYSIRKKVAAVNATATQNGTQPNANNHNQTNASLNGIGQNEQLPQQVLVSAGLPQNGQAGAALKVAAATSPGPLNVSQVIPTPSGIRFDSDADPYSEQITYATTGQGTLQISIESVPIINGAFLIEINKLTPNDYVLLSNYFSEGHLILVINITKSFRDGVVTIKEVSGARRLVTGQTYVIGRVAVPRFDSYSQSSLDNIATCGAIFSVLAWMGIICMLVAILSGYGIVMEEHIIALQMLYLHVFIGYDLLPLSFREVVGQLRTVGFLHFVPDSIAQIEWSLTPEAMYWLSPTSFSFIHAFMPILASLALFTLWCLGLVALKKWCLPLSIPDENRTTLHKMADNIVCRLTNFVDSIWRYQFIAILLICTMQFVASHEGSQLPGLSGALAVLLLGLFWTLFSETYIRNQYYQSEYSEFIFKFEDRYFCKIPLHSLPSRHHRLGYPLLRMAKAIFFILLVLLCQVPTLTLTMLIFLNGFQVWYLSYYSIYTDRRMFNFKILQTIGLLSIQILLLGVILSSASLSQEAYLDWGYLLSTLALLTILLTTGRIIFIISLKYIQSKGINFQEVNIDQRKLQTERAV